MIPYLQGEKSSNDFLNSLDHDEYLYFASIPENDMSIYKDLEIFQIDGEKIIESEQTDHIDEKLNQIYEMEVEART